MRVHMPVPPGELVDRITILRVKLLYIKDKKKSANIRKYLKELEKIRAEIFKQNAALTKLERELLALNKNQWKLEDMIRTHLKKYGSNDAFGRLVSSMHDSNNRRASLKRKIDEALESEFLDEKKYA